VHNGCPPCPADVAPLPALTQLAAEGPLAACVTVLRAQKGVDVFLAAAPAILERCPEARLAVVGNGELRGELEQRAEALAIGPRLRFVDFEPPSARALASLDVLVLPSRWEAFPISILEALACGVTQVASDVGGTSEAVSDGETGLLCPPEDPAALADAVVALLADPDRREAFADASRHRHAERFTVAAMTSATVQVYEHVRPRRYSALG
jgi:glycosyltransferase involved in cell wall biosynthesis